jgi:hypothetical protein
VTNRWVRLGISLLVALCVATLVTAALAGFWHLIGGGDLTVHGWIALLIGMFGSVGLAWLLMALAFKSNREGWDDRVDNSLDPGRERDDQD